jgi:CRP/FNR family transcriptional regulator, cyclic AMP receptor protein
MTSHHDQQATRAVVSAQRASLAVRFLGSLSTEQRHSFLALGARRQYRPGQVVMREGGPADIVVVILSGLAKIIVVSEGGKEILLGLRGADDLVGEMAVLSRRPRSATVIAATDLDGTVISAASFVAHLERTPQLANRISDIMAEKLRAANRRRLEYNAYPAEGRVALVLCEVALAHGHPEGAAWRIGAEITQADLASLASTSVRTIEKVLRSLEQDRLVARRRRDLVVTDLAALMSRAKS